MILKAFKTISAVTFQKLTAHRCSKRRQQGSVTCKISLVGNDKLCPSGRMASTPAPDFAQQLTFMTLPSQFPLTSQPLAHNSDKRLKRWYFSWHLKRSNDRSLSGLERAMQYQLFLDDSWEWFIFIFTGIGILLFSGFEKIWTDHKTLSKANTCKSHLVQFSVGFLQSSSGERAPASCPTPAEPPTRTQLWQRITEHGLLLVVFFIFLFYVAFSTLLSETIFHPVKVFCGILLKRKENWSNAHCGSNFPP